MIEPRPCGTFLDVDDSGYIVPRAAAHRVQEQWKPVIDATVALYRRSFGDNLHSVWLRGSVAKGEAQLDWSDLDTFAYVQREVPWPESMTEGEQQLKVRFPFCRGFELSASPQSTLYRDRVDARMIKTQSICLHGEDISAQIEPFTLREMIHYSRYLRFHLEVKLPRFLERDAGDPTEVKATCGWVTRLTLRSLYELVMLDEGRWTNDLWPCYEIFSRHYPARSEDAMELLVLTLNPVSDEERIHRALSAFTPWIYEEMGRRLGVSSDATY